MLAMPSNLLAHHLHVLEQAGVLTRRRSDGDRRRTYLQLVPGVLESLSRPTARIAGRVLFVCTANSARSHLAAALWRRASTVPAASAGTEARRAGRPGRHRRRQAPPPAAAPPAAPAHQRRPARRRPHRHRVRPGPRGTGPPGHGALVHPRPGTRPAIPPASTRRWPSSVTASSASRRAWQRPADLPACPALTAGLYLAAWSYDRAAALDDHDVAPAEGKPGPAATAAVSSRSGRRGRPAPAGGRGSTPTPRACPGRPARPRAAPSGDG